MEVEFGRATFTVTTLGEEFIEGVTGQTVVSDFPSPGEAVRLVWQPAGLRTCQQPDSQPIVRVGVLCARPRAGTLSHGSHNNKEGGDG